MNPALQRLQAYPFERLRALLGDGRPPATLPAIALSIGEPRHEPPPFVLEALRANLNQLDSYPPTRGLPALRAAMAAALARRGAPPGPRSAPHATPVAGDRPREG